MIGTETLLIINKIEEMNKRFERILEMHVDEGKGKALNPKLLQFVSIMDSVVKDSSESELDIFLTLSRELLDLSIQTSKGNYNKSYVLSCAIIADQCFRLAVLRGLDDYEYTR